MKLANLKTGDSAIIIKVLGHGGFRKRIIEMGFIKGKKVEVLLNAPLQDPVKYKIMGYEVSLRLTYLSYSKFYLLYTFFFNKKEGLFWPPSFFTKNSLILMHP